MRVIKLILCLIILSQFVSFSFSDEKEDRIKKIKKEFEQRKTRVDESFNQLNREKGREDIDNESKIIIEKILELNEKIRTNCEKMASLNKDNQDDIYKLDQETRIIETEMHVNFLKFETLNRINRLSKLAKESKETNEINKIISELQTKTNMIIKYEQEKQQIEERLFTLYNEMNDLIKKSRLMELDIERKKIEEGR